MSDVFEIAEILVSHAVRAHQDEIAIIAYYGSYAKGLASPTSDLDIFYIPDAYRRCPRAVSPVRTGFGAL